MNNVNLGKGFATSDDNWFQGRIPHVLIYNRALSPFRMLRNYNSVKSKFGL
jgi:hypothetical protein